MCDVIGVILLMLSAISGLGRSLVHIYLVDVDCRSCLQKPHGNSDELAVTKNIGHHQNTPG